MSVTSRSGRARVALRAECGEGRTKAIIWTLIILAGIYVAIKIIPPYVNQYQLRDKMQEEARFAVVTHHTEEQIRDVVWREMQDLDIPAKREDIKIESSTHEVKIALDYTVPVDFMVYKTELHFSINTENKSLT